MKIDSNVTGNTVVCKQALDLLVTTCNQASTLPGSAAECGVYKGGSLRLIAQCLPDKTVWGFDTFEGMPACTTGPGNHVTGSFASSFEHAREVANLPNVRLVKGTFPETFTTVPEKEQFAFVHLDCDQYLSYKWAFEFFVPRLVNGALIQIDDYNAVPGCRTAVDELYPDIAKPPALIQWLGNHFTTLWVRQKNDTVQELKGKPIHLKKLL